MPEETYCRNCGVRLWRALGGWHHVPLLRPVGPVECRAPVPEAPKEPEAKE